ncbi:methylmalonyl Co-A mutase-associated GTPase MeaB [Psychrilyobacter sp.]|uniref:methylmalonyl Co-A mutase-associated GTPase MeaB n=1 Tax=Psychrilyobacter sp. TaxID=2586924 RepID=UPI00301A0B29
MENIKEKLLNGNKRAAARLITLAENGDPQAANIIKDLYAKSGNAFVIGVTGPPGAGKSTLTDKLVKAIRLKNKKVGVIAVDPTSPFTGGAILGDRVRMSDLNTDSGVFIRSMGARGNLGGISEATGIATDILDIFGCDYIFIETVGVGQSEIDIVKSCDTTLMVMVPGLGDDIQALKAGIMEIGDIFVVNKADRDGARKTAREIGAMLSYKTSDWTPPVIMAEAVNSEGINEIIESILNHKTYMKTSGSGMNRRIENKKNELLSIVREKIHKKLLEKTHDDKLLELLSKEVVERKNNPYSAVETILNRLNIK